MCGIAGYIAPERHWAAEAGVRMMLGSLARRGPDSEGMASWPGAVLGHRRLAILDLSEAGRQPMLSEDGQTGLVFNGCIYNFLELREDLEKLGHRFRSQCDTEVLLRGYQEWGIDRLVPRLRGMFAFAIWEQSPRKLTLVRDRLGVKPLAYCARRGEVAFASTPGALREAGLGGAIDPQAVLDFLEYGWVNDERSIYEGISKLPPASIVEWSDGRITQKQYWSLPAEAEPSRIRFEEAVEETERLLLESVKLRLISDVPVGALLSAGIDSALVCWGLRELNANITAFTVRAPDDPSDESAGAAHTARLLGISHEIVDMPGAGPSLDDLIDAYSEPFACSSAQALLLVSQAVKRRATVLLTGDGGDDVFLGYPFFQHAWMVERLVRRMPGFIAPMWGRLRSAVPANGPAKRVVHFMDYATGGLAMFARAHDGLPYYEQRAILGERLTGRELPERRIAPSSESARRFLAEVFEHNRRLHFTSEYMPKVDGGTMYHAIEARAPFLDHKLWEFAASLPPEILLRGGRLKAVLREIVRRRVGPDVAFRRKQGFTVPVESWLAERWSGTLDRLRHETVLEREGWVRRGALRPHIETALSQGSVPIQLWRILVLDRWLEKHGAGAAAERAA